MGMSRSDKALLVLFLCAGPAATGAEEGRTAGQLIAWCAEVGAKGVTGSDPYINGMCQGTLRGFITAAEFENERGYSFSVCVPSGTPDVDLIAAFNDWASKNPDKNGEPEWFALYSALHAAYPCANAPTGVGR
jgi:hypothetical protein